MDLLEDPNLDRIELVNRTGCCPERLSNYRVTVFADGSGSPGVANWIADVRIDGSNSGDGGRDIITAGMDPTGTFTGRFLHVINLSNAGYNALIAEFEVYEAQLPKINFLTMDAGNISQPGNPSLPTSASLSWSVSGAESVTLSGAGRSSLRG